MQWRRSRWSRQDPDRFERIGSRAAARQAHVRHSSKRRKGSLRLPAAMWPGESAPLLVAPRPPRRRIKLHSVRPRRSRTRHHRLYFVRRQSRACAGPGSTRHRMCVLNQGSESQMALTPEERQAITGLFERLRENGLAEKDSEAEALINQLIRRTLTAPTCSSSPCSFRSSRSTSTKRTWISRKIASRSSRNSSMAAGRRRSVQASGGFLGGARRGAAPSPRIPTSA